MADAAALSSLGIGSGVLTYDVIDKLKKADESAMVNPYKTKLTNTQNKEKSLNDLITQLSLLKSNMADFQDGDIFQKRTTNIVGSSVTADVSSGVAVQTIDMNVTQLAKNDIYQSNGYASETSVINSSGSDQTITLSYNGVSSNISVGSGATLSDLRDDINNANLGVTASIINTGSDTDPYRLVLKGEDTGKDSIIKLDYGNIDDLGFNQEVYQSKAYTSDTDSVNDSGSDQTFKISVNGTDYSMDVANGTSVSTFVDDINNGNLKDANGNSLAGISASYVDGHIQLHMKDIGDISIDDTNLTTDMNDNTDDANTNRLQTAQDSLFKYNGVDVERSTNKIDDLVAGLTLNLQSTGETTIDIKQDTDSIEKEVNDFVSGYNSLVSKIQDLTKYDPDNKTTGIFQGESDIVSIPEDLSSPLFNSFVTDSTTKYDRNGQPYTVSTTLNATDFGFTMNRTGFLDFDSTKFDEMLKNKPDQTEKFMSGDDGAFTKIINQLDNLIGGSNSTLELLNQQYTNEEKSYQASIDNTQKRLDAKYNTMASQFAAYDEMINSYNVQSQTIQQAIDAMINQNK